MADNENNPDQRQFRTEWIWIPLSILAVAYVLKHIQPVLFWNQVMDVLRIHDRERYTMLLILGLGLVVITVIVRLFKNDNS